MFKIILLVLEVYKLAGFRLRGWRWIAYGKFFNLEVTKARIKMEYFVRLDRTLSVRIKFKIVEPIFSLDEHL